MDSAKYKLIFTVPLADADQVRQAIGEAGAGQAGEYAFCSFSCTGTGRFLPLPGAHPTIGAVGELVEVAEERVECLVEATVLDGVMSALMSVHPYEEVAYDLIPLAVWQPKNPSLHHAD